MERVDTGGEVIKPGAESKYNFGLFEDDVVEHAMRVLIDSVLTNVNSKQKSSVQIRPCLSFSPEIDCTVRAFASSELG